MTDTAEEHWENIVHGIDDADKTPDRFNQSMAQFYLKYCNEEARDTMIEYLREIRRPVKEDPQTFADRMETLVMVPTTLSKHIPMVR